MSWIELESAIVVRLKDKLGTDVKAVMTMAEYDAIGEVSQFSPLVGLVHQGYAPVATPGGNYGARVQQIEHTFFAVVVMRSALETKTSRGARESASPLFDATMRALVGWRPSDLPDYGPMQLAPAPGPQFPEPGIGFYPIAFTNRRTIRGID